MPNENNLEQFLTDLSNFVRYKTGIQFDARLERTTVLDVTRDFYVGESKVLTILKDLCNVEIPKYNRKAFNNTSVYFENKGTTKNKIYKIYSKQHDFIDKGASDEEIELAKGILRLEIHHGDNRAVSNLGKSLNLPNHNAGQIITRTTSHKVINDALKLLNLNSILNNQGVSKLETLAQNFDKSIPLTLAGHLALKLFSDSATPKF